MARERAGGLTARIEETEARRLHLAEEAERLSIQIKETADRENRAHGEAEAGEDATTRRGGTDALHTVSTAITCRNGPGHVA